MGIKNEDDNKSPRKPFIYYYLIVMIVMILFNALMVFPNLLALLALSGLVAKAARGGDALRK